MTPVQDDSDAVVEITQDAPTGSPGPAQQVDADGLEVEVEPEAVNPAAALPVRV